MFNKSRKYCGSNIIAYKMQIQNGVRCSSIGIKKTFKRGVVNVSKAYNLLEVKVESLEG